MARDELQELQELEELEQLEQLEAQAKIKKKISRVNGTSSPIPAVGMAAAIPQQFADPVETAKKVAESASDPGGLGGLAAKFGQGASFGLGDELYAALKNTQLTPSSIPPSEKELRDRLEGMTEDKEKARQFLSEAGEQLGGFGKAAELAGLVASPISRALPGGSFTAGAAGGGLLGFGASEVDLSKKMTPEKAIKLGIDVLTPAVIGGTLSKIIPGVAKQAKDFILHPEQKIISMGKKVMELSKVPKAAINKLKDDIMVPLARWMEKVKLDKPMRAANRLQKVKELRGKAGETIGSILKSSKNKIELKNEQIDVTGLEKILKAEQETIQRNLGVRAEGEVTAIEKEINNFLDDATTKDGLSFQKLQNIKTFIGKNLFRDRLGLTPKDEIMAPIQTQLKVYKAITDTQRAHVESSRGVEAAKQWIDAQKNFSNAAKAHRLINQGIQAPDTNTVLGKAIDETKSTILSPFGSMGRRASLAAGRAGFRAAGSVIPGISKGVGSASGTAPNTVSRGMLDIMNQLGPTAGKAAALQETNSGSLKSRFEDLIKKGR